MEWRCQTWRRARHQLINLGSCWWGWGAVASPPYRRYGHLSVPEHHPDHPRTRKYWAHSKQKANKGNSFVTCTPKGASGVLVQMFVVVMCKRSEVWCQTCQPTCYNDKKLKLNTSLNWIENCNSEAAMSRGGEGEWVQIPAFNIQRNRWVSGLICDRRISRVKGKISKMESETCNAVWFREAGMCRGGLRVTLDKSLSKVELPGRRKASWI